MWKLNGEKLKKARPFRFLDLFLYLIALTVIVSLFISYNTCNKNKDFTGIEISLDGKVVVSYYFEKKPKIYSNGVEVEETGDEYIFTVLSTNGYNKISVSKSDRFAYILNADCPTKDCMHYGKIVKAGQAIICAPHKLIVKGLGDADNSPIIG